MFLVLLFAFFSTVLGAPLRRAAPGAVTQLSASDLDGLTSFIQFARAAYCPVDKLMAWNCGEACDANPNFEVSLAGGMDLTDLNILKGELNSTLFPGAPAGLEIHSGFRDEHALTADEIRNEVTRLISTKNATQVTVVGHSLGGALAELDALSLRLNLPQEVGVNAVTFGTPRVGTADFVQFFDSQVPDFKRVNNEADLVPIVPGRFLGFAHPQGEIHIVDDASGAIVACPGNDNDTDDECQIKTVPSVLGGNVINHLGPYNGIFIGSVFCT